MAAKRHPVFTPKRLLLGFVALIVLALIFSAIYLGTIYASSPPAIRDPKLEHYHFRLQIVADGKYINFAQDKYQTPETGISCDAKLPDQPIHLHDHKNQIVHIHWNGMTGGLVLKNYGWNKVGGPNDVLGYRFDSLPHIKKVPIHGKELPAVKSGDSFYVYVGDEHSFKQKSFNDFLQQDLEVFFNHRSNFPGNSTSLMNFFFPKALAHEEAANGNLTNEQLTQLNNLIGNAVIFAQKNKPTDAQVKAQFSHLEPLSTSVCGS